MHGFGPALVGTILMTVISFLMNRMVKDQEIPETEVSRFKREMKGQVGSFKAWIAEKIEQRVNEALSTMDLVTVEDAQKLFGKLADLEKRLERLEKRVPEEPKPGNVVKLPEPGPEEGGEPGRKAGRAR